MDSIVNPTKFLCRVCGETGHYDLFEMKFRFNDTDVMLIEAFNCFSSLNNVNNFLIPSLVLDETHNLCCLTKDLIKFSDFFFIL